MKSSSLDWLKKRVALHGIDDICKLEQAKLNIEIYIELNNIFLIYLLSKKS